MELEVVISSHSHVFEPPDLGTRWEVIVEEFMPIRIKHRAKNST